jgi:hypothetical protein
MIHAYRLIYLKSPHAPPTLWEWEQPWIQKLIVNTRRFYTPSHLISESITKGTVDEILPVNRSWCSSPCHEPSMVSCCGVRCGKSIGRPFT